jgi:hypothetical protein
VESGETGAVGTNAVHEVCKQKLLPGELGSLEVARLSENTSLIREIPWQFLTGTLVGGAVSVKSDVVERFERLEEAHRITNAIK